MIPLFLFGWLRARRRSKLIREPFPQDWEEVLYENVRFYAALDSDQRERFRHYVQIFVREKNWEGCGGQVMTDEIKVTIAGFVGVLVSGLPPEYFDNVLSILVYPEAYRAPAQTPAGSGVVIEGHSDREGEAWYRGPVILSWSDVTADARGFNPGHNLVLHEFAHQLDMLNGSHADGTPPMRFAKLEGWEKTMQRGYRTLLQQCQIGANWLDAYATTNRAEFFAVTTEAFFETPREFQWQMPEVYEALQDFYQVDPLRLQGLAS